MSLDRHSRESARFGSFEISFHSGELRKHGVLIRLAPQPFQVLSLLVEKSGEIVTREELQQKLWGKEVVEFEAGLNRCISQIRTALSDRADLPRCVETIPRKGYRFIQPVTWFGSVEDRRAAIVPEPALVEPVRPPTQELAPTKLTRSGPVLPGAVLRILLAGAFIVALVLLFALRRSQDPHFNLEMTPLASALGEQSSPALSPSGREIAYSWNAEGNSSYHIYVKLIGTPAPLRLTSSSAIDYSPVWSPDGKWIAFCRGGDRPGGAVYVIPALGGSERKLACLKAVAILDNRVLSWTVDGKWLAVAEPLAGNSSSRGISLVNVQDGHHIQLTRPNSVEDDMYPVFSPDGRTLLFTKDFRDGISALVTMPFSLARPAAGMQTVHPWKGLRAFGVGAAAWTPDSRYIVFSANLDGNKGLWCTDAEFAREPVQFNGLGSDLSFPTLSLDGKLAYVHRTTNVNVWIVNLRKGASTHPPEPKRALAFMRSNDNPSASPDGKRIAFASNHDGSAEIWVSNLDGSNLIQLTQLQSAGSPAWSPDGRTIVFDSRADGRPRLYVIPADGGQPKTLTVGVETGFIPAWSSDGQWIYYTSARSGEDQVWRISPDGQKQQQVSKLGGFAAVPSPDGKYVYYSTSRAPVSQLWRYNLALGQAELISPSVLKRSYACGGDAVYFFEKLASGESGLYRWDNSKTKTLIWKTSSGIGQGVSIPADRSYLLFSQYDQNGSDLMLASKFWRQ